MYTKTLNVYNNCNNKYFLLGAFQPNPFGNSRFPVHITTTITLWSNMSIGPPSNWTGLTMRTNSCLALTLLLVFDSLLNTGVNLPYNSGRNCFETFAFPSFEVFVLCNYTNNSTDPSRQKHIKQTTWSITNNHLLFICIRISFYSVTIITLFR